ncbi:MAG: rane fusion protein [Candidatus Eremiobacteraeota bacterium]|nr:rane fusion protein [Candidatus Eremiobacteraeota bacterium]
MKVNRKTAVTGGVAAFAAAGLWLVTHRGHAAAQAPPPAPPSVPIVQARLGDFDVRISAQGHVGPPAGSSAKLPFAQPGIVGAVDVHVGDHVRAGQPVAELRQESFAIGLAQARADTAAAANGYGGGAVPSAALQSAQAKLAAARNRLQTLQSGGQAALSNRITAVSAARQAAVKVEADRTNLARVQQLYAGGVSAMREVEAAKAQLANDEADQRAMDARVQAAGADFGAALAQARADVALAQSDVRTASAQHGVLGAQVSSAQARAAAAQLALHNAVLRAPADGVVIAVLKHTGESVDVTTPVVEIGPPEDVSVTLQIPGGAAQRVRVGDPAVLRTARGGAATPGSVIAVVPAVDPATQVATVIVRGVPAGAVPGDAISGTITVGHRRGVLVPQTALVQDPQTGKTVVFVPDAQGKFTMRDVAVGPSDDATAIVDRGLRAGEGVAARGGYELLAPSGGG